MFYRMLKGLAYIISVIIVVLMIVTIFLLVDYKRFLRTPVTMPEAAMTFSIEQGDSVNKVVKNLRQADIQMAGKSPFQQRLAAYYFRHLAKTTDKAGQLKVGTYQLRHNMTPPDLLDLFVSGKVIVHKVRFIEGKTFKQMLATLRAASDVEHTLAEVADDEVMKTLQPNEKHKAEGLFYPDTYVFADKTKDRDILNHAYHQMQKHLKSAWEARDKRIQLKTPYELLILASIIEKETALNSERKQISGVFHRRLAKGMRLQTDPTVIYGMGDKYKGKIYKSDLKKDTPYNTYRRKGLPPTPIAMPSLASLMAAGQPDNGKSLYFVANGTGGHTFSDTYKQHLRAVRHYRKQQKKK